MRRRYRMARLTLSTAYLQMDLLVCLMRNLRNSVGPPA